MSKADKHSVKPSSKKTYSGVVSGTVDVYVTFENIEASSSNEARNIMLEQAGEAGAFDWEWCDGVEIGEAQIDGEDF